MSSFKVNFDGGKATNIKQYSYSQSNLDYTYQKSNGNMTNQEMDYGEVEEFDYESYFSEENQPFDLNQFYKEQEEQAKQYEILFEQTLEDTENEKKELETAYRNSLLVTYDSTNNGMVTFNGYQYATLEEYIQSYLELIDPNSCIDPETFAFSETIYRKKKEEAEQKATEAYQNIFNTYFEEKMGMTYDEYQKRIEELNSDISNLKSMKYELAQQIKEYPYLELSATEDYQKYKDNHPNEITYDNIENLVTKYVEETYPTTYYGGRYDTSATVNTIMNKFRYELLSEEDKMMCLYLYEKKGLGEVYKYVTAIEDRLNKIEGEREASKFITSISANGKIDVNLWTGAKTAGKGVLDGIDNFGEGLLNVFTTEGMISSNQYAQMYILEALKKSKIMTGTYQFSIGAGNMLPSMAVSAIVSILATPGAGSVVGSTLMGFAAGGNSKNQALIEGNTLASSYAYGACVGLSETTLGYFLGKMPGLSKSSEFTLKNLFMEGMEEFSQEWVDAGLQAIILKQDIDWSKLPEQSATSFVMGVLMAGLFEGGQAGINIIINGVAHRINVQKTMEYLKSHPEATFEQSFLEANEIHVDGQSSSRIESNNTNAGQAEITIDFKPFTEFFENCYTLEQQIDFIERCDIADLANITKGEYTKELTPYINKKIMEHQTDVILEIKKENSRMQLINYITENIINNPDVDSSKLSTSLLSAMLSRNIIYHNNGMNDQALDIANQLLMKIRNGEIYSNGGYLQMGSDFSTDSYDIDLKAINSLRAIINLAYEGKDVTSEILGQINSKIDRYFPSELAQYQFANSFQKLLLSQLCEYGKLSEKTGELVGTLANGSNQVGLFNFGVFSKKIVDGLGADFALEVGRDSVLSTELCCLEQNFPNLFDAFCRIVNQTKIDNSLGVSTVVHKNCLDFMFRYASQLETIDASLLSTNAFVNYILFNTDIYNRTVTQHSRKEIVSFDEFYGQRFANICDQRFDEAIHQYEIETRSGMEVQDSLEDAKNAFFQKYFSISNTEARTLVEKYFEYITDVSKYADNSDAIMGLELLKTINSILELDDIKLLQEIYNTQKFNFTAKEMLFVDETLKKMYTMDYQSTLENMEQKIRNQIAERTGVETVNYNGKEVLMVNLENEFSLLVYSSGTGFKTDYNQVSDNNYVRSWNQVAFTTPGLSTSFITSTNPGTAPVLGKGVLYAFTNVKSDSIMLMAPYDVNSNIAAYGFTANNLQKYIPSSKMSEGTLRVYNEMVLNRAQVKPDYLILYADASLENYNSTLQAASEWNIPVLKIDRAKLISEQVQNINNNLGEYAKTKDLRFLKEALNVYEANISGYKLNADKSSGMSDYSSVIDNSQYASTFQSIEIEAKLESYIQELIATGDSNSLKGIDDILGDIQKRYDFVNENGSNAITLTKASFDIDKIRLKISDALESGGK